MTREECESEILTRLEEIVEIYHRYNPDGTYLTMAYIDGDLLCNNRFYTEDAPDFVYPIDVRKLNLLPAEMV